MKTFSYSIALLFVACYVIASGSTTYAATLRVSPDTGVYTVGGTFTAQVTLNTQGKAVNAADGQLSFNPRELSVVSATRGGSIFNLWTQEPSFSNSAGTISFGGGSPTGYTGSSGSVISITFRPLAAGTPKVTFKSGSVLAADGMGTNVLTGMTGASYTIAAKTDTPAPEYIPPANTPAAPKVTSTTHPDQSSWYKETAAKLAWSVPQNVTAVRTLLDDSESTVPTIVYDEPITSREIPDLPQGVSYFHIQFKNAEGWGRVTHYRLGVDSEPPSAFEITEADDVDSMNPAKVLVFTITDSSPILRYSIQVDGGEPIAFEDNDQTKRYTLPTLPPGHHTVVVEAVDSAGNSRVSSYSFDITSFEAPVFTEYPSRLSPGVIPALKGSTRADAEVHVTFTKTNGEKQTYTVRANSDGEFIVIPDAPLSTGVYDVVAVATDAYGATSEPSPTVRLAVEEAGFLRIGSMLVSVLSIIVPLLALLVLSIFGSWFLWHRLIAWKRRVEKETLEAEETLRVELDEVITNLDVKVAELRESRKGKLTQAETALIEQIQTDILDARTKLRKEIADIENIVE